MGDVPCAAEPDAWYSTSAAVLAQVIAVCQTCPALVRCQALGEGEDHGIWGGIPRGDDQRHALGLPRFPRRQPVAYRRRAS